MARQSVPGDVKRYRTPTQQEVRAEARELMEITHSTNRELMLPQNHGTVITANGGESKKTPSCMEEIIERVARGETLHSICKDIHMPAENTVWNWIRNDETFAEMYYEAKRFSMNAYAEDIITIADDSSTDLQKKICHKSGDWIAEVNYESVRRSELRIRARQWLMERILASRFHERVAGEAAVPEKGPGNITVQIMLPDNQRPINAIEAKIVEA